MTRCTAGMIAVLVTVGLAAAPSSARAVSQWKRYELEIKTPVAYHQGNPYRDLKLEVYWSKTPQTANPANPSGYGFWDGTRVEGGNTFNIFKIRTALEKGTFYLWYKCSGTAGIFNCGTDSALNRTAQSALSFQITANNGSNLLYKNGFLRVPPGARYITYTGDPAARFHWRGDTAWPAPAREGQAMLQIRATNPQTPAGAVTNSWKSYVDDRSKATKGYTVVQVAPAVSWRPYDRNEGVKNGCRETAKSVEWDAVTVPYPAPETFAFEQISSTGCMGAVPNNCSRWRPGYWREVDAMVEYANSKGMVVVMAGVADPSDLGHCRISQDYPKTEDSVIFARNLAARLAGNHVIFSINFDDWPDAVLDAGGIWSGTVDSTTRAVGPELRKVVPRHLIANHMAGSDAVTAYTRYHNEPWLSFHLFHSGHALNVGIACPGQPNTWQGKQKCAIGRALDFTKALRARTPAKPVVNGEGPYEWPLYEGTLRDLPPDNRYGMRHAAYASLLTGSAGFTAGAHGPNGEKSIAAWIEPMHPPLLQSKGLLDLTRLDDFLKTLYPAGTTSWGEFTAAGTILTEIPHGPGTELPGERRIVAGTHGNNYLAYVPNSLGVNVVPNNLRGFNCITWPVQWRDPAGLAVPGSLCPRTQAQTSFTNPKTCTDVTRGDKRGLCDLFIAFQKPPGQFAQESLYGSYVTSSLAQKIIDSETGIVDRGDRMTSQLMSVEDTPLGPEMILSAADEEGLYGFPAVIREPLAGVSWVVWEAGSASAEGTTGILARRVGADGTPLGDAFRVEQAWGTRQYDPFTVADAAGNVTIVWVSLVSEEEPEQPKADIFARRFRADGTPLGDEFVVNAVPGADHQDSPVAGADLAGNLVVGWRKGREILFRLFSPTGASRSGEIRLRDAYLERDFEVDLVEIVVDPLGSFVVRWNEYLEPDDNLQWYSRSFSAGGQALGGITHEGGNCDPEESKCD